MTASVHVISCRRRLRLAWRGTRRIARRRDGTPFDGGGWGDGLSCTAHRAARAINAALAGRVRI